MLHDLGFAIATPDLSAIALGKAATSINNSVAASPALQKAVAAFHAARESGVLLLVEDVLRLGWPGDLLACATPP
jgi:hypothetical protein